MGVPAPATGGRGTRRRARLRYSRALSRSSSVSVSRALAGHRSLLLDLLGFGISDRPADQAYTLEMHADLVARVLEQAVTGPADVVAHSVGGAVASVLAGRHPQLVRRLVLVDPALDPVHPLPTVKRPGSSGIGVYRTEAEFLDHGWAETLAHVGPDWAATMRLGDPRALYRTAMSALSGGDPTAREHLESVSIPRTLLYPASDGLRSDADRLAAAGVRVVPIPDCGHNIMIDNVDGFAHAVAAALLD
ncbi:MAG: alpha/beta fold hydrolase [Hamadaea sp.]|uniref:alpha/beta fold hydrolase n=1 Tax=Hamadaea sp. TaxID=2024425 RepID=UPI001837EF67|nr:alpha/beta fold hydrolase [Hamadaea sp.]NUT18652.1 alpha/beta fold hydrolase [Hamadaea sp.]